MNEKLDYFRQNYRIYIGATLPLVAMWPLKKYKCPLIMVKSLHFIWTEFATSRNVRTLTIIFQKLLRKLLGFRKLLSGLMWIPHECESKYSYKEVTIYIRQNVIKTQKNRYSLHSMESNQ